MHANLHGGSRLSPWEAGALVLLFLTAGVWGAAATAVGLVWVAGQPGCPLGELLLAAGPDRIMRRCLMGFAALFIAVLLWRAGWRSWRDTGFFPGPDGPSRSPGRQALLGIGLGLVTLGSLSLLTLLLDLRIVTPVADSAEGLRRGVSFIGSGIAVALIEETVCRGLLFRVLARAWTLWPAAAGTSLLFALAHFLTPDPRAFQAEGVFKTTLAVALSTFTPLAATPLAWLVFANLTLLGMTLCGFVNRTGTLWLAIGAHAAWVWVIKFFHLWTDLAPGVRPSPWLGTRSDFMDSFAVTLLLLALVAWGFRRPPPWITVRRRGLRWRVAPGDRDAFLEWLERHGASGGERREARQAPLGGGFTGGRLLKDHHGSRVLALDGWVVKTYGPKAGWTRFRFALRASRTRRAFLLARDLLAAGIATPRPLAWTIRRRFGLLRGECLVVEEAAGCERLTDSLAQHARDPAVRARILAAYGRLAARFHLAGYSNRDMKHDNIMGSIREPWELQVVDLDGVRRVFRVSRRRAGRDLMRVGQSLASRGWADPADARAFFEAYNMLLPPRLRRPAFPAETRRG